MTILGELRHLWRIRKWLKEGGISKLNTDKLGSRKLWMTIIGTILATVLSAMDVDPSIVKSIVALFGIYLGAQGVVDLTAKRNGG